MDHLRHALGSKNGKELYDEIVGRRSFIDKIKRSLLGNEKSLSKKESLYAIKKVDQRNNSQIIGAR